VCHCQRCGSFPKLTNKVHLGHILPRTPEAEELGNGVALVEEKRRESSSGEGEEVKWCAAGGVREQSAGIGACRDLVATRAEIRQGRG